MRRKQTARSVVVLMSMVAILILAACQPVMPDIDSSGAETSDSSDSAMAMATALQIGGTDELGDFLVDGDGLTLYMFTKDEPGVTNCYDKCAENWPPLIVEGDVTVGDGLDAALVGTTERTDGGSQVTYNGWPLYYWIEDNSPGDAYGQNVGEVWFVLSPAGEIIDTISTAMDEEPASDAVTLQIGGNDELGDFLVDSEGLTLYMFTKDEPGVTNCYDKCAENWPPLIVEGDVTVGDGLDAALVDTTERTDGGTQVTYNGWPLYYWIEDNSPGDAYGQNVGEVWFVLSPAGEIIQ